MRKGTMMLRQVSLSLRRWLESFFPQRKPTLIEPAIDEVFSPPPVAQPKAPAEPIRRSPARKEALRIAKLRREISGQTNDLLDRIANMSLSNLDDSGGAKDARASIIPMMNADFHFPHFADEMPGSDWKAIDPEREDPADLAEAMWPLDFAMVMRHDAETVHQQRLKGYGGCWQFTRTQTADPQSLRGRVKMFSQKMVTRTFLQFWDNGKWYSETTPFGLINKKWRSLNDGLVSERPVGNIRGDTIATVRSSLDKEDRDLQHLQVSMDFSAALTGRYNWHAALGSSRGGPRLLLPTTPDGCLWLFKDRQKDQEAGRRAALRHWVGNHFRDLPKAGLTYVRDHLRGETAFNWYDLACDLMVSDFDLEKNELFKTEAEQWRRNRKHNSVRIRLKKAGAGL